MMDENGDGDDVPDIAIERRRHTRAEAAVSKIFTAEEVEVLRKLAARGHILLLLAQLWDSFQTMGKTLGVVRAIGLWIAGALAVYWWLKSGATTPIPGIKP